jgi:chromosome partitioning protein
MHKPFVIAIVNEKGGTGKTTTSVSLSAALGEQGQRVLLVDLDGQAASSRWVGVEEDNRLADALCRGKGLEPIPDVLPNVSLAPASGKLDSVAHDLRPTQGGQLRKVLGQQKDFDFVLIDCPPSLGNRLIGNALLAATHVLVPVETSILALDGLRILLTTLQDVRDGFGHDLVLAGVLACRYDPRTRLSRLVLAELRRALPAKVFDTVIRENVRMRECPASGQSILGYAGESHAAEDYRALATELLTQPAKWQLPVAGGDDHEEAVGNLRNNTAAAVREANRTSNSPRPWGSTGEAPADEGQDYPVEDDFPAEEGDAGQPAPSGALPAEQTPAEPAHEPSPTQEQAPADAGDQAGPAAETAERDDQTQAPEPTAASGDDEEPTSQPRPGLSLQPCVVPHAEPAAAAADEEPASDEGQPDQSPAAEAPQPEPERRSDSRPAPAAGTMLPSLAEEYSPDRPVTHALGPVVEPLRAPEALPEPPIDDWVDRLSAARSRLENQDVLDELDQQPQQPSDEPVAAVSQPAQEPRQAQTPPPAETEPAEQSQNAEWLLALATGEHGDAGEGSGEQGPPDALADGEALAPTEPAQPVQTPEVFASQEAQPAAEAEAAPQPASQDDAQELASNEPAEGMLESTSKPDDTETADDSAEDDAAGAEVTAADGAKAEASDDDREQNHPALRELMRKMAAEGKLPGDQSSDKRNEKLPAWRRIFRRQPIA